MSESIEQLIKANTLALTDLAAAIREAGGTAPKETTAAKDTPSNAADNKGPFHWHNPSTDEFGVVKTKAQFEKLKASDEKVIRIPESKFDALSEAAEAAAKGSSSTSTSSSSSAPSEDDLKKVFGDFLRIDDEGKRNKRKAFVTKMVDAVGVSRASEIPENLRAAAIKMIEDVLAGKKVDPEDLPNQAAEEEEEEQEDGGLV